LNERIYAMKQQDFFFVTIDAGLDRPASAAWWYFLAGCACNQ